MRVRSPGILRWVTDTDGPVFPSAPPDRIDLPGRLALARWRRERASSAAEAINASLEHLQPWMAWASEPATEESMTTFFAIAEEQWAQRRDFGYSIVDEHDSVVGGCGLHARIGPNGLEIGYWVHVDWIGKGVATAAARALTDAAFGIEGIERVRIQCEDVNVRSARVPEKLGYTFAGVDVPEDGPCSGRPTQVWWMQRSDWEISAP